MWTHLILTALWGVVAVIIPFCEWTKWGTEGSAVFLANVRGGRGSGRSGSRPYSLNLCTACQTAEESVYFESPQGNNPLCQSQGTWVSCLFVLFFKVLRQERLLSVVRFRLFTYEILNWKFSRTYRFSNIKYICICKCSICSECPFSSITAY